MRITICDDEENDLMQITGCVSEYINNKRSAIDIKKFTSPAVLLKYEQNSGGSELYLLDIVMEGMSGIELGGKIREYNKKAIIIYLTTAKEFSLDAFGVNAFSYIVKPFEKEKLFAELDKCFSYYILPQFEEMAITINTTEGVMPVSLSRINAVEYLDHRLIYALSDGRKIVSRYRKEPFDIQTKELSDSGIFVKTANCYLINMYNIMSTTSQGFKMKNGDEYNITRKYADAKVRFLNYKIQRRL